MWGEVISIFLGAALILAAVLGKAFYAGFSPKARVSIPALQGRIWLLISGALIVLTGGTGLLGNSHTELRHFVERAFVTFDFGYEMFAGLIAILVGAVFLFVRNERADYKGRLLGAAAAFFGVVLITDALWKMRR